MVDTDAAEPSTRHIADRADAVRPMLDLRARLTGWRGAAVWVVWMFGFLTLAHAARAVAPAGWKAAAPLALGVLALPLALAFNRARGRRLREARERMVCPRCRYTLREKGPGSWISCDDTLRRCPECAYAITDDVYAAAVLPTVHERAQRTINRSRGAILALALMALALLVPVAAMRFWGVSRFLVFASIASMLAFVAVGSWFAWRLQRAMWREVAAWLDEPYCTSCAELLPPGAPDLTIAVCPACDGRTSPPVARAQARDAARRLAR